MFRVLVRTTTQYNFKILQSRSYVFFQKLIYLSQSSRVHLSFHANLNALSMFLIDKQIEHSLNYH